MLFKHSIKCIEMRLELQTKNGVNITIELENLEYVSITENKKEDEKENKKENKKEDEKELEFEEEKEFKVMYKEELEEEKEDGKLLVYTTPYPTMNEAYRKRILPRSNSVDYQFINLNFN